ncbi:VCBS domain-containing protein [Acinetobacter baumannii]
MTNFIVVEKDSLNKVSINTQHITLTEASIVHTKMHRNDVAEFLRDGNNLILKLNNGETVLIENFFVVYDKVDSDLVFEEDGCILYWFDGVSGFKGIPGLEVLLPASAAGGSLLPWIIGGGAVIGGIIAAAGSGGGGDKNAWPIAVKDEITGVEDTPVNGNVLTNDRDPDGNAITVTQFVVEGKSYNAGQTVTIDKIGELTLNADGTYHFVPATNWNGTVPTVTYTISDGQGGTASAELVITITPDANPSISIKDENGGSEYPNNTTDTLIEQGHVTVYEQGLTDTSGSNKETGSITIGAGDGVKSVTVGDTNILLTDLENASTTPIIINTPHGKIIITDYTPNGQEFNGVSTGGTITYEYELDQPVTNDASHTDNFLEEVGISVTDQSNIVSSGSLVISIIDDAPLAKNDIDNVAANQFTPETGNVLTGVGTSSGATGADKISADGVSISTVVSDNVSANVVTDDGTTLTIEGQYGTLILNKTTGEYSYERHEGTPGGVNEVFTYTLVDGDGDSSTASLTLVIGNSAPLVTLPSSDGESTKVYESGLNNGGSKASTDKETTSGTIAFTSPDGLASQDAVKLGGHTLTTADQTFSDGLTARYEYNSATGTGTIHYSYTLPANTSGDNTNATFAVEVTDIDGDKTASGDLVINIIDDAPVAKPDTNSITEDSVPNPVSGNVLTGGVSSGDTADTQGADKANVSGVQAGTVASGEHVANGALNTAVNGEYGTLILRADGSYTYQLNNNNTDVNALKDNQSLQDVFSYTITDGDGDKSTATITITINGHTDGAPNVVITDHNGSALGANSIAENATTPVQGEFTVNAADGLKSITIGGTTILTSELLGLSPTTPKTIIGTQGTLTLTDYDPVTGKVSYSYQQSGTSKNHSGGDSSVSDSFPIIVTDNADESSVATDLVILITDTAPEAKADTGTVTEDGTALEGNVITGGSSNSADVADRLGADATQVTGVSKGSSTTEQTDNVGGTGLAGDYGTLILNSDGSYSYTVDPNNTTVNALKDGGKLTETFSYTIKDADGDWSTTTLTITINGHTDGLPSITPNDQNGSSVGGQITVYESGLSTGSNASAASEYASGTIQINAGDGLSSINIGGQNFSLSQLQSLSSSNPSAAINVVGGTIVLNGFTANSSVGGIPTSGSLSYTYTLNNAQTHSAVGNDGLLLSGIPLSVTDAGGVTTTGSLVVQVIDDVPTAVADTGSLSEGGVLSVLAADGVLTNDTAGADGWVNTGAVVGVVSGDTATNSAGGVGGRIDGQYGYITLNADGSYTYVSTADAVTADAQDVFTYTVRDADGDLTHSTLTINVANVNLTPAPISNTVNESGLAGGSTAGTGHTVTDTVNLPSEVKAVPVTNGSTQYGTFSIDEDGHYTYTLTKPSNGDNVEDTFSYTTKDAQGNSTTNTVTITIIDDAPVAKPDTNSITEDSVPNPVSGNVLTGGVSSGDTADTQGADKANVSGVQAGTVASGEHVANGALNTAVNGEYGTLILRADGSYTYQLNNNNTDVNALKDNQSLQDVFSYTITDGDGDKSTATITITINGHTDGAPNVVITDHNGSALGANSIAENATTPVQGEFTVNAADGLKSITIGGTTILTSELLGLSPTTPKTIIGTQGTLTLTDYDPVTGKVSYSYQQSGTSKNHSGGDSSVSDSFPIIVTDNADESSVATDLVILITDTAPEAKADTGTVTEDGTALEGNVITGGSSNSADVADRLGADATQVTGVSKGSSTTEQTDNVGGTGLAGDYGTLILNSDGSYSYTVDPNNTTVNALKDGGKLTETFSYTIKDADGDWSTTTLTITINGHTDGLPSITPNDQNGSSVGGQITVYESGLSTGSNASAASEYASGTIQINAGDGLSSINIGGQNFSLSQLQSLSSSNPSAAINVVGGTIVLNGFTANSSVGGIPTSGSLSYTYTLNNAQTHSAVGNDGLLLSGIPLSVTDAGGVTTTGSLVVQVIDDVPTAVADTGSLSEGGVLSVLAADGVLTNDTAGADGWVNTGAVVGVVSGDTATNSAGGVGGRIDGQYGYITLNADGSYTYVSTADAVTADAQDVFTYTVRDADGDLTHSTLTINVANVNLTPAPISNTVNESGLAGGSTAGTGHTVTDTVNLPSEVKAVPVTNGSTQYGTFSIDEDGHYTYTLTKPSNGDNVEDTFSYTTKDAQGNSTTNTVTITIIDDAPVAKPDTNSITEDSVPNPVSGNVLTGGVSSGDTADTQGADKANVSGVQAGTVASGEHVANGALNTAVNGEYGTLILRADGSYTYQLNNNNTDVNALKDNQSLQDVFSYTITDGDGDKSTATITITINGHTDGAPNVVITDHNGSALGANSIAENATTPVQGEFTVNAADGLKSITIGGTTILTSELLGLSPTTPKTIIGTQGTLTLTDYDPVTGKVSYSYQQSGTSKNHSGGDSSVSDSFPIIVTDNADESSVATDLVILITDTAPEAKADTGTVTEDGTALEGNVITGGSSNSADVADRLGADATQVTGVSKGSSTTEQTDNVGGTGLAGDYGTLILNSDGSYSYTVDPNNTTVNALKDGGKLTETFSYTIKDADGDWSTTTLTITINGHTDGLPSITPNDQNGSSVGGQITVYESGLSTGSNASAASEYASGTIQINAGDGLSSINIGGQNFSLSQLQSLSSSNPSAAINVVGGTIVLNGFTANSSVGGIPTSGSLSYTYTLNNAQTHSAVGNDGLLLSGIPLSVTDAGGVTTTGSLVVQVIDDVPTAVADTGSLSEGGVLSVLAADGVLTNDTAGADGWVNTGAVVGVVSGDTATNSAGGVGGRIDGQYGYITLNADGSYTYVSTADAVTADAQDVFTYTVRDADGDLTHSTLTINVANVNLTPAPISNTVNESGLAGGSTAGTGHTVTDTVNLPSEVKAVPVTNGSTQYGTFSIDEDGHYTYTLTKPSNGDNVEDTFSYTTKDAQGNSTTNTVTITIIDDAPVAKPDTNSITEDSVPNPVSGNVLTGGVSSGDTADTQGADKANVSGVQAGTVASGEHVANGALNTAVNGEYGTLILRADGSYTYQLNNNNTDVNALKDNQSLQDVFSYTITDGDGDKSTATITITINGHTDGAPNVVITDHNGSALGANSIAENATTPVQGEFTVNAADGLKSITIGGTTILTSELLGLSPTTPKTIIGTQGTLTLTDYDPVTGKVSYSYQQSGTSKNHSGGDSSVSDSFPIIVTDNADESSVATDLVILITDTAPEAKADTGTVTEDGTALEGNVITGGSSNSADVADRLGADATQVTGVSKGSSTTEQTDNVGGTGLAGDYGTLILNSDGSYSYTVDPNNTTVNALKDGGKLTETFSYTIKDADGDWSTTTLTITINGHTDGLPSITPNDQNGSSVGGQITVYESGLSTGSNASAASEYASGTIQINAGDGLSSINIGGQNFSLSQLQSLSSSNPSAAINVVGGTIVLNGFTANSSVGGIPTSGSLSYTYTLNNAQTHSAVGNDGLLLSGIPLSVTDAGGVTTTGSLVVQVIDDVPTAVADTGSLSEGGVLSVLAADGVLTNDTAGADGWVNTGAVVGVVSGDTATNSAGGVGGRIDGQYGYITLNADGSYTYVSTADAVTADAQDVFTYTVRDADGDLTHSTLTINVANVNLTPAPISNTVNESGLAGGSTAGTGHTVTDTVNLPSEVKAVPVTNGSTQYGTFSIDEDGHYTYTLTKPSNGDNVEDTFSYTTKDAQGNSTTNTVTITIIDDAPVAKPDTNSITEDSVPNPVSGNVLTGGVSSGDTADTQGADKANVSGVQAGTVASGEHVANGALNTAVNGEYGTLILRADGSYTYQLNNNNTDVNALKDNQSLQDVFSYTITDGDGDKSTATITITINGHTDGAPNVVITDHNGSALGANSIAENATTPVQGEFTVNAADGLKSITIGGTTILTSELLGLSPTTPKTIIGTQGTLTLTDYDPVTGKVSYSYQQSGTSKNHSGGDSSVSDSFPIIVTDNADESSVATDLVILITDTAPEAKADTGTVTEDGTALEGNVITGGSSNSADVADRLGADATQVTGVSKGSSTTEQTDNVGGTGLAGDYGTLILNSDGSYSYTVDPNNTTVNALKDGGKLTETFSYTIKDADGDWSTTTLTITINGHTDGLPSITPNDQNGSSVGGQITVYESGLSTGSNASAASEYASGTIQINAGDGLSSINIGGQNFSLSQLQSLSSSNPSAAINVVGGTIVLNGFTANSSVGGIPTSGSLSYTYTLNNAQTHSAVGNDGLLLSGIPLSVTDAGGVTTTGSLVVQVIDDVPTAVNDSNSIPVGSLAVVTGNVVSNDTKGADGARVTTVKADTANGLDVTIDPVGNYPVVGKYGTLTIHSDGSYSYARNAGSAGGVSDVFTYTLTDGDNDTSTAQLTINIADATPTSTIPTAGGATTTVYESSLNNGGTEASTNKETTSGTISFTSPDGLAASDAIKLGGHTLTTTNQSFSDGLTARYEYNAATGTGTIYYSYTLPAKTSGDNTTATFAVEIKDADGDSATAGNLVINIVDDAPITVADTGSVTEGALLTKDAASGVLSNDQSGADGWAIGGGVVGVAKGNTGTTSSTGVGTSITGDYGTLTLNANGSYSYKADPNKITANAQDVFTYTVRDADGDLKTSTLTINVQDVTANPLTTVGSVREDGIDANGTQPAGTDASSSSNIINGDLNLQTGWTAQAKTGTTANGTYTVNSNGTYSFNLTKATTDQVGVSETNSFTYTAVDQYGNTVTNTVTITIVDDKPKISENDANVGSVTVDESNFSSGSVSVTNTNFVNGVFTPVYGADGQATSNALIYALNISSNGVDSGLDTTSGQNVLLYKVGNQIEGRAGSASGDVVFRISIDPTTGAVTLTQSEALKHPVGGSSYDESLSISNAGLITLTATATDGDGDAVTSDPVAVGDRFIFKDDGPSIGSAPAVTSVDEKGLATGSEPNTSLLTAEGNLSVSYGQDGSGNGGGLLFATTQTALRAVLDSTGNSNITFSVNAAGNELTATRGGNNVFKVTLDTSTGKYSFKLLGSLNHPSHTLPLNLNFDFIAKDGDGDTASGSFVVKVIDDAPKSAITITMNEDHSYGPFTTSADAQLNNITIQDANGNDITGTTNLDGSKSFNVAHGTVTVDQNGQVTYKPADNYSNYDGSLTTSPDTFKVLVTDDSGQTTTTNVTVNVNPVADAPTLTVVDDEVETPEDTAVSLGLKTPVVTDNTDQNGNTTTGDSPERLGVISLSGILAGAALLSGTDATLFTSNGGNISIWLTDVNHPTDETKPANALEMTSAEFEALKVLPPAESHANFTVTVSVTSYEVDDSGAKVSGVNGATSTATVVVNVQAVTDGIDLKISDGNSFVDTSSTTPVIKDIAEDTALNLTNLLQVTLATGGDGNSIADTDGSEQRWMAITGLPEGTTLTVSGQPHTITATESSNGYRIDIPNNYNGVSPSLPSITVTPPKDFSGDINNIQITLHAQDQDSDGVGNGPTTGTEITDSVYLNLHVTPVAGDVAAGDVSTNEDTAVAFLQNVRVTDTTTGTEVITQVAFEIPTSWVVTAPTNNGGWSISGDGSSSSPYTITFNSNVTEADREAILDGFTILPPAHSSQDATIQVSVTSTDTNGLDTDTQTKTLPIKVTVNPVAEIVGNLPGSGDSDKDGTADLTMTGGHSYTTAGAEDTWYTLGTESGFNLANGWTNQDADELTYAHLTPELVSGDSYATVIGSQFKWTVSGVDYTATYTGTPIDVPVSALSTLQFLAPENVSGTFKIKVEAYIVDYDDDNEGTGTPATAVSGEAWLEGIIIAPVADGINTLSLNGRAIGLEDTPIPLSITPRSSDPSETFNITISDIPAGAKIIYGGVEQTITNGSVTISNFSTSTPLTITPPFNSNVNFTLSVTATATDGSVTSASSSPLSIHVTVYGVADTPTVTLKDYDSNQSGVQSYTTTEANLDGTAQHKVSLSNLIENVSSIDNTDGSESFTLRITGLAKDFNLGGRATVLVTGTGEERVWVIKPTDLNNVFITVPENYSGNLNFKVAGVSTENDGDSKTGALTDVNFTVTPSAEAEATTSATLVEDEITTLNFGIVHVNGDNDETLGHVWIAQNQAAGANYTLYLGTGTSAVLLSNAGLPIKTIDGVDYYELTAEQAQTLAAKGGDQLDGDQGFFTYKYEVTDNHYGSVQTAPADTVVKDGELKLTASAVTDAVELSVTGISGISNTTSSSDQHANDDATPDTATLTATDTVTVNLNVASIDHDGSEHVVRILIENVPEGVTVQGANVQQIGAGTWVLVYQANNVPSINAQGGIDVPVTFKIGSDADGLTDHPIKITVQTQDLGSDLTAITDIKSDSVTWYLNTDFAEAPGSKAPLIDQWQYNDASATEDTPFKLSDVVDQAITIQDNSASNLFTVTLKDLPAGTIVNGMVQTMIDTNNDGNTDTPVWTASVTVDPNATDAEAEAALQNLLDSIVITPPADWNDNGQSGQFHFDATLTTSVLGGATEEATIQDMTIPIAPVTDNPIFTMSGDSMVGEGATAITSSITLDPADGSFGKVVDGKMYVQVNAADTTDAMEGGQLYITGSTTPLVLQSVDIDGDGTTDGDFYVIDIGENGGTVDLTYTMPNGEKTVPGNVSFTAYANVQEDGADVKAVSVTGSVEVQLINNGVNVVSQNFIGNESELATKANAIELTGAGGLSVSLNDSYGSESYGAILLSDVPNGFLVYVGNDAASATLASNAGGDGTTNTWVLSESGGLPAYVAILPPIHWSGTVENLQLVVTSGESSLSPLTETKDIGDLVVNAVANGVDIKPTQTFGKENEIIPLNLNASMHDPKVSEVANDSSTETMTIKLTGLGQYASFYIDGVQISSSQITVSGTGSSTTYTITGLTQSNIDKLGFKQAKAALTDQDSATTGTQIGVEAWTVESGAGNSASAHVSTNITVNMTAQQATTGNDTLLYTASSINAGAGIDTIQLRSGETVSGATLAANLKNVEVLDLSVNGANNITSLTASHVLTMTDAAHTLKINGTAEDTVGLGSGWTQSATNNGYVTYTSTVSGTAVTLLVSENVHTQSGVNPLSARSFSVAETSSDDVIVAKAGNDTITTGQGHDTLIYNVLDASDAKAGHGIDHWTDFGFGSTATDSNAETIQFSSEFFNDLLSDSDLTSSHLSQVEKFIKVDYDAATESATVKVDRDGEANGSNYQDLLVLEHQTSNVTLAELLNNHQITIG